MCNPEVTLCLEVQQTICLFSFKDSKSKAYHSLFYSFHSLYLTAKFHQIQPDLILDNKQRIVNDILLDWFLFDLPN